MRSRIVYLAVVLSFLSCGGSARAVFSAESLDQREADQGPCPQPVWDIPNEEDRPWFEKCRLKIQKAVDDEKLLRKFEGMISCTFLIESDGAIADLFIWRIRNEDVPLQDSALSAVLLAAPFSNPPSRLSHRNRFLVTISKGGIVDFKCDITNYGKYEDREYMFQVVRKNSRLAPTLKH